MQGEENQINHEDDEGKVVMVTERRTLHQDQQQVAPQHHHHHHHQQQSGHVVIRGTSEKLMSRLMEDGSSVDPTFTEDFLLTYRTFLGSPVTIMERLLEWFEEARLRDKVGVVVIGVPTSHKRVAKQCPSSTFCTG